MVYVHLAEGFEEIEAVTVVDVLRRGGVETKTVSVCGDKNVKGTHGMIIEADLLFEEADYEACDMIVLPGGLPGADNLKAHKGLGEKIFAFAEKGKKLAAICAAPMVLGECCAMNGRTATIYPGMEGELPEGVFKDADILQDGNIITGRGPAFAADFALTLLDVMAGEGEADEVADGMLYVRG